jgi:protocatechuate 3,4-dioxygenase beta subunit
MDDDRLTREELVRLGLVLPLAVAVAGTETTLAATPACADDDEPTVEQTEGPYFTPRSPRRRVLRTPGMKGTPLLLTGRVLTTRCRPIPNAQLDFWQADGKGVYDNRGYRLRGHQRTDALGRYRLETIVPGLYPGRTRHIHVKAQAPRRPVLTTQLYFRGERANASDGIFVPELLVRSLRKANGRWSARFDFVLDVSG